MQDLTLLSFASDVNYAPSNKKEAAMSRPTLKVPSKPALDADADTRPFSRKPVRAGFTAPKQTATQRASSNAAKAERLAAAVEKPYKTNQRPRATPRFKDDAPAPRVPARPAEPAKAEEARQPREVRTPVPPKTYPKRGIARSTGARALPPARYDGARDEARDAQQPRPQPAPNPASNPAPLKPIPPHLQARREAPPESNETRTPRRSQNEPPRLAKQISEMCQCSRREADEWIENGWVRVDGVVVTTLGTRVHPNAKIEIKEEAGKHQTECVTILLNKPLDMASGKVDGSGEAALQLIRPENRWAEDETRQNFKATHLRGLALAGKLDPESTGMLVFTQEGSVARRITGDDTRLEKEYMVRVEGELTPEGMKQLNHGLSLDDVKLKKAQVSWQNEQQLRFVLHESKKRQIQRMCELVGLTVTSIKRIRIGSVSLGKLPAGQWRYLREGERF
jgi:23S rRNA pseudouridine2604 synthase